MKNCLSLLVAAALLLGLCSCGGNRFRLEVETAPETGCDNCAVYLFARMGNQLTLVDSARLVHRAAQLSGPLPDPENLVELLIPGQGSYILLAARGERVSLRIDTAARSFFPACRGSFAPERMTEISRRYREIGYGALEQLRSEAAAPGLDAWRRQELEARLAAREAELDSLARSAIFNDRSALLAIVATMWYADTSPNMTEDSLRALVRQLRARFPGSPCLNSLDEQAAPEPPTRESMRMENLRARLSGLPEPYPEGAEPGEETAPGSAPEPEPGTEACSLPPYAVGERVEAFSLPDGEGVRRNPLEAAEEYVLLDFWASWCAPCRRELPVLLDAASRFDGVLSVCAVSVDEDAAAWRSAVEQEGLSPLLNLRLDRSDASFAELVARFDIRTIPHNLLLDGERRVVAVDLRGDALREWLEKELKR